jgi:hypothetical protein
MGDELSAGESRALRGCDHLLRGAAAWFTAADIEKHAVRAAVGRAIGGALAGWFTGGLAYELGPIAWSASGLVLALSVWAAGAPAVEDEEEQPDIDGMDPAVFLELVHDVAAGGNVHLTAIGEQLREETGRSWDVLALCRAAGIPTKPVRVPGADPAVTTGIHRHDLPPLPHPLSEGAVGVVSAGEADNNNTPTVTPIGQAGWINSYGSIRQEARR